MERNVLKRTIPGRAGLADVGARLKALRLAQGLSVNELAMRAGVSVGTVSQLERNKSNPSVRILELLRQALMVPLSALFEESAGASEIEVRDFVRKSKQRPLFEVGKSGMKKELLTPRGEHDLQMIGHQPRDWFNHRRGDDWLWREGRSCSRGYRRLVRG